MILELAIVDLVSFKFIENTSTMRLILTSNYTHQVVFFPTTYR